MKGTVVMDQLEALLKQEERAVYALRELYHQHGYSRFKMSKFEAYDLYARNKDFLVSDSVITFTDTDGTLMALKPDVTLSIVKNYRNEPGCVQKVYYNENVYRVAGTGSGYREILQTGLECLGAVGPYELCEVLLLALQSLRAISERSVLNLSHMGVAAAALGALSLSQAERAAALQCIGEKNEDGLRRLCERLPAEQLERALTLIQVCGPLNQALDQLHDFDDLPAMRELRAIAGVLDQAGDVNLDFSITGNQSYYNGIIFRGYVEGIPSSILSGGQYDKLMARMGKGGGGVGFAVYLDQLERLDTAVKPYDVDTVLLYGSDAGISALLPETARLRADGRQLLVVRRLPHGLRYRRLLRYQDGRLELLEDNG